MLGVSLKEIAIMKKYILSCILFVSISTVVVLTMADADAAATLNDYWNGNADWKYVTHWPENSFGGETWIDGVHMTHEPIDENCG